MNKEEFCDKYCPMATHIICRDGTVEVDCGSDMEDDIGQYCPFKSVPFKLVKEKKKDD